MHRPKISLLPLSFGMAVLVLALTQWSNGMRIEWSAGVAYGLTLAVVLCNPLLVNTGGATVSLAGGLLLAVCWEYGLPTAWLALVCAQAGVPAFGVSQAKTVWAEGATGAAAITMAGLLHTALAPSQAAGWWQWVGPALLYWLIDLVGKGLEEAVAGRLPVRPGVLALLLPGAWWAAPIHLTVAALVVWSARIPWMEPALVLVLVLAQRMAGALVNARHQDRAVVRLLRQADDARQSRSGGKERILRYIRRVGLALGLPEQELRLITYAGLLQDIGSEPAPPPAVETSLYPPDPSVRTAARAYSRETAQRVEQVRLLYQVAGYIRFRYAWWNGNGEPEGLANADIPMGAQVLAVANALALMDSGREQAIQWLRTQSGRRLSPQVAWAGQQVLQEEGAAVQGSPHLLADVIRRLQSIGGPGPLPLPAFVGRWLYPLRHFITGYVRLPEEFTAVAHLSHVLNFSTSLDGALEVVLAAVSELAGGAVLVALVDDTTHWLAVRGARGFHRIAVGRRLEVRGGAVTRALVHQEVVELYNLADEIACPISRELADGEGIRSGLILPLVARGRTLGLLFLGRQELRWFSSREIGMLTLIADQAALAVDNSRLLGQAEERLDRVTSIKRQLDLLIDQLPAGVLLVDATWKITVVNRVAQEILVRAGYPLLEAGETFHPSPNRPDGPLVRVLREGENLATSIWQATPDLEVELRCAALKDEDGKLLGALVIGWDVTQVRLMEQQVQRVERLAAMGTMAAGAAHEIRNPLAAIRGFMQLLAARQTPGSPDAEYTHIILSEIGRIETIVRDLLLLARPGEPQRAPVSLTALLDEVLLLLEADFSQQRIEVVRDYRPDQTCVLADAKLLKQVVHNLLRNAAEAMDGQGGCITVTVGRGTHQVWFRVQDTGAGIAPADLPKLFTPFFTTKESGTGLGLAICYSIIEAHGGKIEVASGAGEGAAFSVWLPPAVC